jgi:predicted transcriptional regulator
MMEDKALEHQTRKRVYNYITRHPGAIVTTLQQVFDLAEGTLRYHLHYLERHRIVYSTVQGKFRCYYISQGSRPSPPPVPTVNTAVLTDVQKDLAALVQQNPGITISEMESRMNLERRVLQYNLKALRDMMIIWKVGNGRGTRYEFTSQERVRKELFKLLVAKFLSGEIDEEKYLLLKGELEREELEE